MTKIMIITEGGSGTDRRFRASFAGHEAVGSTAGAALDALTVQVPESELSTPVIIHRQKPDVFFGASKQKRMEELLEL